MPILGKVLLPSGENKENDHGHGHKKKEKKKDEEGNELKNMNGSGSYENEDSVSVHEVLIHPNYEDQDQSIAVNKKKKNMWVQYFKKFDETILKPILIYKYSKERKEKQFELYEVMRNKGMKLEQEYTSKKNTGHEENKDEEIIDAIRKQTH